MTGKNATSDNFILTGGQVTWENTKEWQYSGKYRIFVQEKEGGLVRLGKAQCVVFGWPQGSRELIVRKEIQGWNERTRDKDGHFAYPLNIFIFYFALEPY